nr:retrovirus-related Pol polyprotein from transposon TNT 1-94 [Tanacetum cinerariifolium]
MKEGASIADHVNEFNSILSRLMSIDINFNYEDKEVNMVARDYNDALVCCVENTIDDRIIDYGASFHATYCKEELERFKLRSGKVFLADDKTLDIAGVRDVVLKTFLVKVRI